MKKNLFFIVIIVSVLPLCAARQANAPAFEMGYIKMATVLPGLCGGVTLVPNADAFVRVRSYRLAQGWFGSGVKPGKPLSTWIEIPENGLRVAYDQGGPRSSYHYRLHCQTMNPHGVWLPTDCAKVIRLEDVQHNRPCVGGPAGPSASYAPLNMRTKAKPITGK